MIRKLLLLSALCFFGAANGQQAQLKVGGVAEATHNQNFPLKNSPNTLITGAVDTLQYFMNKHYYRNSQFTVAPNPNTPENNLYYTIPTPYSTTLQVTHFGSVFNNSVSLSVTGLQGIVAFRATSASSSIPVTFILANLNGAGMPILPGLDSVTTQFTSAQSGDWIGDDFTSPVTVTGRFAVLVKIGNQAAVGDTIWPFMNNAATPTSTAPVRHRYGEGLGRIRFGSTAINWATTATGFGGGADYEFLLAPRVMFDYDAAITVNTPTICTNSAGSFSNASIPVGILEHKQFNFNAFYKAWSPWALTTNSLILNRNVDSIYQWNFTGATTSQSYAKHPSAVFNSTGTQNVTLNVRYKPSTFIGLQPSLTDIATENIVVSNASAPVIVITAPAAVCAGSSATITASGNTTFTWTSPASNASMIVVSPTTTTMYSVSASNLGCVSSETVSIMVSTAPTVAVTSPTGACVNSLFTLTATGANSYSWSNAATTASTTASSATSGIATYSVAGTNVGCPPSVAIVNITINDKPQVSVTPATTIVCTKSQGGLPIDLIGEPSGGNYSGNGVSNGKFTPNNSGTFTATYNYNDPSTGCSNIATTSIKVDLCTVLSENQLNRNIRIYPNPAVNGKITIGNLEGANVITVYNILGSLVSKAEVSVSEYQLDLSSQAAGTYFMRITEAGGDVRTVKIINSK